ncbi:peroxiredoxin [Alcanivorax sp. 1008]|uniref:peroxiredoxin n=1 Tax=Alcanivorax sp. 1008 TaxID=2816853 RepID=UPI001D8A8202|nr:peroxiredoxin [Alcanivorax sp. 1008]MCC1496463.1 peroxiredoxin [Alcanivorax sp. 1008]
MTNIAIGKKVPDFSVSATSEQIVRLKELKGRKIVLYFYPRDSTPGCTTEGQDFRDLYSEFKKADTEVFGVSQDSLKSHENFRSKQNFPFQLISDEDGSLCRLFDVIKMKNMYGKQFEGIERSTFLIDASGKLQREWRKVKVPGHVAEVLQATKEL